MGPTEVKFITDLAAALGVPGGIIVALWMVYQSNRGKAKDPAADVLDALTKIEDAVDDIDSRLIRVETRAGHGRRIAQSPGAVGRKSEAGAAPGADQYEEDPVPWSVSQRQRPGGGRQDEQADRQPAGQAVAGVFQQDLVVEGRTCAGIRGQALAHVPDRARHFAATHRSLPVLLQASGLRLVRAEDHA